MARKFKAFIIESEAGWGSRIDETLEFDTREERDAYVAKYNATYNTAKKVPSWYMRAEAAMD